MVVGDKRLLNNEETLPEAIPGAEVPAFLSVKPVMCCSFSTSGCDPGDFRVVEVLAGTTEIEDSAFQGCGMLVSVTIPNSVTVIIGNGAFENCSSLASVNSVTEMGLYCFSRVQRIGKRYHP